MNFNALDKFKEEQKEAERLRQEKEAERQESNDEEQAAVELVDLED